MDILGALSNGADPAQLGEQPVGFQKCSRRGCQAQASCVILWNNPKIHEENRRKRWLACPEHTQFLQDFLQARGFWRETEPLG